MAFKLSERSSGLLLHITSLPGPYYLGDLGAPAHQFIKFLADAGQGWWQMLPINPIGDGNSPYSSISSFAGEPLLIDLVSLVEDGWLKRSEIKAPKGGEGKAANYARARSFRREKLRLAFSRAADALPQQKEFAAFRTAEASWLGDFTLFAALAEHLGTPDWTRWPAPLRDRDAQALAAARQELEASVTFHEFTQFLLQKQWRKLRTAAAASGVGLLGDLPIFVSLRSADVWAHRSLFQLDQAGRPLVVAGVPPDAFNKNGQLWGNALYDWTALERTKFGWWIERLRRMCHLFDAVRLDHFIGFARYFAIPAGAKNARGGTWVPAPGAAFFREVARQLPGAEFIAEDLGAVTPAVRELRDQFGFPGMKVLQFAFDGTDEAEHHKPHALPPASVAYTGTHDNNTTRGWYNDLKRRAIKDRKAARELSAVAAYLGTSSGTVHIDLMRAALASPAKVTIFPVQDILGLTGAARMNTPGVPEGNWRYRVEAKSLNRALAAEVRDRTAAYDRIRSPQRPEASSYSSSYSSSPPSPSSAKASSSYPSSTSGSSGRTLA